MIVFFLFFFCCFGVSTIVLGNNHIPPSSVRITDIFSYGDGCPELEDSTTVQLSFIPGSYDIDIQYSNFTAEIGAPTAASSLDTKHCFIRFTLHYPGGWAFRVSRSILTGNLLLSTQAVTASRDSIYTWSDHGGSISQQTTRSGPYNDDFSVPHQFDTRWVDFSTCSLTYARSVFTVIHTIGVGYNRTGNGRMDIFNQRLLFDWQIC